MKAIVILSILLAVYFEYTYGYCGEPPVKPPCECTRGNPFWSEVGGECNFACRQGDILLTCEQQPGINYIF